MDVFVEVIGWIGAAGILAGYFLFSIGKIKNGFRYQWLNLIGALALMTNAYFNQSWPFVLLNVVWSATAVFALVTLARSARAGNTTKAE